MSEKTFRFDFIVTEVVSGREVTHCNEEITFDADELFASRMCRSIVRDGITARMLNMRGQAVEPIVDEVFSR